MFATAGEGDRLLITAALKAVFGKDVQFSLQEVPAVLLREVAPSVAEVCNFPKDEADGYGGGQVRA